jgi:hypothetical protein
LRHHHQGFTGWRLGIRLSTAILVDGIEAKATGYRINNIVDSNTHVAQSKILVYSLLGEKN